MFGKGTKPIGDQTNATDWVPKNADAKFLKKKSRRFNALPPSIKETMLLHKEKIFMLTLPVKIDLNYN